MEQRFGRLVKATSGQGLYSITGDVRAWVAQQGISHGLLTLWCRHTSASLLVQANAEPEVLADLEAFFLRLVPEGRGLYRHEDEALDNMPAHIRAALTQISQHFRVSIGLHQQGCRSVPAPDCQQAV